MHEFVPLCVNLLECFTAPLRQDEVTRVAVAGFDRLVPIGSNMFAVVAPEASVPVLVSNKIRVGSPIDFYFGKEVRAIDSLRLLDNRLGPGRVGIRFVQ